MENKNDFQNELKVTSMKTQMKIHDLKWCRNRVKILRNKEQPIQRSENWFKSRNTIITASEAASCLTLSKKTCENYVNLYNINKFKYNDKISANSYESLNDYIIKKCKAFNGENVFFDNKYTIWGKKYEEVAVQLYKKLKNTQVYEFGLLKHPYLRWLGASPDGITSDGVMLEIKCPLSRKINEKYPPFGYYIQVQIQLQCALLYEADFLECEIKELNNIEEYLLADLPTQNTINCDQNNNGIKYKGIIIKKQKNSKHKSINNNPGTPRWGEVNVIDDLSKLNLDNLNEQNSLLNSEIIHQNDASLSNLEQENHTIINNLNNNDIDNNNIDNNNIDNNDIDNNDIDSEEYIYQDYIKYQLDPLEWVKTMTNDTQYTYDIIYYIIDKYNIINIKRDDEWFEHVKPELKKIHEQFRLYQLNPNEYNNFYTQIENIKNKKHNTTINNSICCL